MAGDEPFAYYGTPALRGGNAGENRVTYGSLHSLMTFDALGAAPLLTATPAAGRARPHRRLLSTRARRGAAHRRRADRRRSSGLDAARHIDLYDVEPYVIRAADAAATFLHHHLADAADPLAGSTTCPSTFDVRPFFPEDPGTMHRGRSREPCPWPVHPRTPNSPPWTTPAPGQEQWRGSALGYLVPGSSEKGSGSGANDRTASGRGRTCPWTGPGRVGRSGGDDAPRRRRRPGTVTAPTVVSAPPGPTRNATMPPAAPVCRVEVAPVWRGRDVDLACAGGEGAQRGQRAPPAATR